MEIAVEILAETTNREALAILYLNIRHVRWFLNEYSQEGIPTQSIGNSTSPEAKVLRRVPH